MRKRIYLHTNTEFSFLYSKIKLIDLFKKALENKLEYLPLTDVNNLYALPYYYDLQVKTGIKPIVGIETKFYVDEQNYFKIIVLAKNNDGLALINQLIYANSLNQKIMDFNLLKDENLYVIDHYEKGMVAKKLNLSVEQLPNNFYFNSKKPVNERTVFAPTKRILDFEDNEILGVLDQIAGKEHQVYTYYEYFDDAEFDDLSEEVYQNMLKMVESIKITPPDNSIKLAKFSDNSDLLFKKLIQNERFEELKQKYDLQLLKDRVLMEYETIKKLGFIDYFLIIWDALKWARENNIEIGPGRGSASGSLIAYLLHITEINPLDFGLLFERFLNVDRVSLPDIDLDIQDNKRDLLLKYLQNKYGSDKVALITTFQTLASKNSIRDVARILKIPTADVNKISASLTKFDTSLTEAYEKNKKYRILVSQYPNLHEYASQIEGLPRQTGLHAAGVVIASEKLINQFPISLNENGFNQIQFTMNNLEQFGLIKIDFLGLKNLTILQEIESLVPVNKRFDYVLGNNYAIFADHQTFDLLNKLTTNGIFQLESDGMKKAIKLVHVDSFDDLYAIISLFRPGPMQYIEVYAANKRNPNLIEKIHPLYDEIVAQTYGIIVYQEQIMQIAQKVGNLSFAQADLLRRAISKKDESKLHSYKNMFFEGGRENNISLDTLDRIYSNIEKFAAYGFNKSHAVAYALIAYKLAYYKARFPFEFYSVLLSNSSGDLLTIKKYALDARSQGIKVNSPKINISTENVEIYQNELYLPLIMIKGVGVVAVNKIVSEIRQNGKINNLLEGLMRLKLAGVGDSVLTTLIKANVFREFGNVEMLLGFFEEFTNVYNIFAALLKKKTFETENESIDFLRSFLKTYSYDKMPIPVLSRNIDMEMRYESELLGDIYNAIPNLVQFNQKSVTVVRPKLIELTTEKVWVLAYLTNVRKHPTKKMVTVSLKDETASVICYGFSSEMLELANNNTPRMLLIYISNTDKNFLRAYDWKEYVDEDN
ncbi:DNA polymerase III subunit alpha [Mycoplasma buteonis]|uniref:DNA polymerase III subunit alpha n=1 Tax=Mycoplasma buteonis TaxID=171280 RepID=UPI00055EF288|nr:DNA polymerase III subunit alpha [Mycoplasma buteonis]